MCVPGSQGSCLCNAARRIASFLTLLFTPIFIFYILKREVDLYPEGSMDLYCEDPSQNPKLAYSKREIGFLFSGIKLKWKMCNMFFSFPLTIDLLHRSQSDLIYFWSATTPPKNHRVPNFFLCEGKEVRIWSVWVETNTNSVLLHAIPPEWPTLGESVALIRDT